MIPTPRAPNARTAIRASHSQKNLNQEQTASQRRDSRISTPRKAAGRLPSCPWLLRLADSAANPSAAREADRPARGQLGKGTAGRNGIGGLPVESGSLAGEERATVARRGEEGELEGSRRRGGEGMRWLNGEGHFGNSVLSWACRVVKLG